MNTIEIILNVLLVLLAIAMIAFILLQRGAGAQAGSGFGAGASGTVFGARGAATFLTRTTAILATVFFVLSLTLGVITARTHRPLATSDLGVMGQISTEANASQLQASSGGEVPAIEAQAAPTAAAELPVIEAVEAAPAPAVDDPAADGEPEVEALEEEQSSTPEEG